MTELLVVAIAAIWRGGEMAGSRFNAFRLIALAAAIVACVSTLLSSQLSWVDAASNVDVAYAGLSFHPNQSGDLSSGDVQVLAIAALVILALAAASLIPYLRFLSSAVAVIGAVCIAYALTQIHQINQPVNDSTISQVVGHVSDSVITRSPGIGSYVLITGGLLAVISGTLTLLTPRTARSLYQPGARPSNIPTNQPAGAQWPQEGPEGPSAAMATAFGEFPAPPAADTMVRKPEVLYIFLGLIIPGLPSLLIRDNKLVGAIQLVVWILSLAIFLLTPLIISFLPWIAVAIWSSIIGYGDAQNWNRSHGFVA